MSQSLASTNEGSQGSQENSQLRRSGRKRKPVAIITGEDYGEWKSTKSAKRQNERKHSVPPEKKNEPKKRRKQSQNSKNESECDLFRAIKIEGTSIKLVVQEWLEAYDKAQPEALTELTNFMIQCCGCNTSLSVEDGEQDRDEIMDRITHIDYQMSNPYLIISKEKKYKKFKSRYCEFWKKFVMETRSGQLYDEVLINYCMEWLITLSGSQLRSFRHTATLGSIEILNALIEVSRVEHISLDTTQRQLKNELAKKKQTQGVKAKIAQYNGDIKEFNEHIEILTKLMQESFSGVFVHRYRDIDPPIRQLSLESLGFWMLRYPILFLKDNYLKYIGWCLYDKDEGVRKASIESVVNLYNTGDEDVIASLELFTQRFLKRFSEMTEDKSPRVSTLAINLMTLLLKNGILSEDDGDKLPSYIWDADDGIRKAAIKFVYEDTFSEDAEDPEDPHGGPKDEKQRKEEDIIQLLNIYDTCCPYKNHHSNPPAPSFEAIITLVEGFWPYLPALKDWDVMLQHLILSEKSARNQRSKEIPTENRQCALTYLFLECAKRATGNENKTGGKQRRSKKEKQEIATLSESLSAYLIGQLNEVLTIFQAERTIIGVLVQLPRYIQLDQYAKLREKLKFKDMLKLLRDIYLKHTDETILRSVAVTWSNLSTTLHPMQDDAVRTLKEMISHLVERFSELVNDAEAADTEDGSDKIVATTVCITRLLSLYQMQYITECRYSDTFDSLLQRHLLHGGGDDLCDVLLRYCWTDLMWPMSKLDVKNPDKDLVDSIVTQFSKLVDHISFVFESKEVGFSLKHTAFKVCSDMFVMFTQKLSGTTLNSLAMVFPNKVKELYIEFLTHLLSAEWHPEAKNSEHKEHVQEEIEKVQIEACLSASKSVVFDHEQQLPLAGRLISFYLNDECCDQIIKMMMSRLRQISPPFLLNCQLLALQIVFKETGSFDRILTLSRRLSLVHSSFQKSGNVNRSNQFLTFIKAGINYAVKDAPHRFGFLSPALGPFISRLTLSHLQHMLEYWRKIDTKIREVQSHKLSEEPEDESQDDVWDSLGEFSEQLKDRIVKKGGSVQSSQREQAPNGSSQQNDGAFMERQSPDLTQASMRITQ